MCDGGNPVLSLKSGDPGETVSKGKRRGMSQLRMNLPSLHLFKFIQVCNGWDDAHPQWWGQFFFTWLLIQMLISSRDSLTHTRNNILPAMWASLSPIKLICKINYHHIKYFVPCYILVIWSLRYLLCTNARQR